MDLSPEQLQLIQIFFPYAFSRNLEMRNTGKRFVHYTSAEAAISMIRNREVWMRKSSVMNDFMEIEHGMECLKLAYEGDNGERFKGVLDTLFPGIIGEVENLFNSWLPHFRRATFLTCISEHEDSEDGLGRLSMWRAYGNVTGVALVLNPTVFLTPSDALKAYTSPVAYLTPEQFKAQFDQVTDAIEGAVDLLRAKGKDYVVAQILEMFRYAVLCTKHPGFHEEREWRIIYSPEYQESARLVRDLVTIRGTPQPIYKIPLEDVPDEGLLNASVPGLIDRVIIGPTRYPLEIRETFVELLREANVEDAASRVFISSIPLRTD